MFFLLMAPFVYIFLLGSFISNLGIWMQAVAQSWLVAELTLEPFWSGFIGFLNGVPLLAFSLLGGLLADRYSKKKILLFTQSLLLVFALLLFFLTQFKIIALWSLGVLVFIIGAVTAFNNPTYQSFMFGLGGAEKVGFIISLNAMQMHFARMMGPSIGGYLTSHFGVASSFLFNAISFLAVIPLLFLVKEKRREKEVSQTSIFQELKHSFILAWSNPFLRLSLSITFLMSLFIMPHLTLLAVFVKANLKQGPDLVGNFWLASGFGSLIISACSAFLKNLTSSLKTIFVGVVGCSVGLLFFSFIRHLYLDFALLFFLGAMIGLINITTLTLIQTRAESAIRGKMMGLWNTVFFGFFPVGNFIVGSLAQWIGISEAWALSSFLFFFGCLLLKKFHD